MKKLILSAVAICAFTFANAQDKKESTGVGFGEGDVFISGGFGISSSNNKNTLTKESGFAIQPKIGFFVSENIALGARIGFGTDKTKVNGATTTDLSALTAGVFGRYNFSPKSQFSVFTELGFDYVTLENKITPSQKTNGFGIGLSLGLNYFVSSNFALEASYAGLNYGTSKSDTPGAQNVSQFSLESNLNAVSIGLLYKF